MASSSALPDVASALPDVASALPDVSPTLTHVSPTPTPELLAKAKARMGEASGDVLPRPRRGGDLATSTAHSRPLRLRVRKIEAAYLPAIETGAKLFDITQQRYLGTAHGWTLGWDLRAELQDELWIGLSPVGRQNGIFVVTHFACLESCDTLDGVTCWADCARLRGAGLTLAQANARDANDKTALDATKPTYAWRFKSGSVHKLREPSPIDAFCGPWGETSLRAFDYADTPLAMFNQMTLSLVPSRTSRKRAALQQQRAPASPRRYVVGLGQQQELEGAAVEEDDEAEAAETAVPRQQRKHPWDHGKTELALSLNAALRPPAVVDLVSSDSELEEDDRVHCGPDHPRRRLILDSDSSDDDEPTDSEDEDERWAYQFVDDEAQEDGASDETQEDEDLPTTADRAFINDDTEASNYDEDEGTWSEQEEEGRQGGDLSSALSRSLGSVDTDSEEDELDE